MSVSYLVLNLSICSCVHTVTWSTWISVLVQILGVCFTVPPFTVHNTKIPKHWKFQVQHMYLGYPLTYPLQLALEWILLLCFVWTGTDWELMICWRWQSCFSLLQSIQTGPAGDQAFYPVAARISSLRLKLPMCESWSHLQIVPRLRMHDTVPPLTHTP